jgi:hypothetical protein
MLAWLDIYRREDDDERGKVAMTIEIEGAHATTLIILSTQPALFIIQNLELILLSGI